MFLEARYKRQIYFFKHINLWKLTFRGFRTICTGQYCPSHACLYSWPWKSELYAMYNCSYPLNGIKKYYDLQALGGLSGHNWSCTHLYVACKLLSDAYFGHGHSATGIEF